MEQIKRDTLTLADRLNRDFAKLDLAERIERIGGLAYRAVFTTGLTMADQVLSRAIALSGQSIVQTTPMTGLSQPENSSLRQITCDRYALEINAYEQLSDALKGADVWIINPARTGGEPQSKPRFAEWDSDRGVLKINPLADWTQAQIRAAIAAHEIPVNPAGLQQPTLEASSIKRAADSHSVPYQGNWWRKQRWGKTVSPPSRRAQLVSVRDRETCLVP